MENIFTITDDLEIMGALKAEGQGSVYKGRRSGEVISAVKLLPKPDSSETGNDYLKYIEQELLKLRKLREDSHTNVVKILDAGISRDLNLPFIEMEFVEGLDLEKLSQPPYDLVFSIKETLIVAEQLCNAMDHCHRLEIIHGDLKSSNVKFNRHTGNYVVVNFGLAAMPQELRHASLVNSNGTEFIAPEQHDGRLFYQTDVYRFGLILFKLLAGSLPSFLKQTSTAAGSASVTAGELLSDLMSLRIDKIPSSWSEEDRKREMYVPKWMASMINKCLETNTKKRFATGMQLREYLTQKNKAAGTKAEHHLVDAEELRAENQKILLEKAELEKALEKERFNDKIMYRQWKELNEVLTSKERELKQLKQKLHRPSLSPAALFWMLLAAVFVGAFFSYSLFSSINNDQPPSKQITTARNADTITVNNHKQIEQQVSVVNSGNDVTSNGNDVTADSPRYEQLIPLPPKIVSPEKKIDYPQLQPADTSAPIAVKPTISAAENYKSLGEYKVKSKAYLYDKPNKKTRTDALIIPGSNDTIEALDEQNGFIYIVFTNHLGQTSIGWLKKQDLTRID